MPKRYVHLGHADPQLSGISAAPELRQRFDAIRAELDIPAEFPAEVLAEAEAVASRPPALPERDETGLPFLTIDPEGSMDLDQAMHLERSGSGYHLRYAIADVPAFVAPGGAIDLEARRRGQTFYAPDVRTPLHPSILSEGAASLLPGEVRPAFVWDIELDAEGEGTSVEVYRAMVRSVDRLDYHQVQRMVDDGSADERLMLLREVGRLRIDREQERGGASLPMPEQEVTQEEGGQYRLGFRPLLESEDWNAQISLLTGMAAADLMLHAEVGILRTMPEADHRTLQRFHREARALGVEWRAERLYGEFLRGLDRTDPRHLALIYEATSLFRGAGYTYFEGEVPDQPEHAAVASPYAHVTAPLRRLVDRFGLLVCEAISQGTEVPEHVRAALPSLPEIMAESDKRAGSFERACTDAVEAAVLAPRVGERFPAVVVDETQNGRGVLVQMLEPAVVARADGQAEVGTEVDVELVEADVTKGAVHFRVS